jgi:GT2 family glycosyltransferase
LECTVVIATLGGPWLVDQLASLAAQEHAPREVIVVNNGTPGALSVRIDEFRERLPNLTLIEDSTVRSPGYARNVGARHSSSPGLLFLDDDDVVSPNYVLAMAAALDEADLVSPRIRLDMLNPADLVKDWQGLHESGPMSHFGFLPWTFGGALGVRRETFDRVGGFDDSLLTTEDTDLCWRAQLDAGATFRYVPEATLNYRLRLGVRDAFRQSRGWGAGQVALYRRYHERGWQASGQLRAALRWGRSLQLLVTARNRIDLVVAARHLGARVGRLGGSVRHRRLFL